MAWLHWLHAMSVRKYTLSTCSWDLPKVRYYLNHKLCNIAWEFVFGFPWHYTQMFLVYIGYAQMEKTAWIMHLILKHFSSMSGLWVKTQKSWGPQGQKSLHLTAMSGILRSWRWRESQDRELCSTEPSFIQLGLEIK